MKSFRVDDIYNSKDITGLFAEFGTQKMTFEKILRSVSTKSDILTAELSMGLDHITLNESYDPLKILKHLTTP